jgi:hypothetical protein
MNIYSPAKKFKDWIEKCAILIAFRWIGRYILFWLLSIFKKKKLFLKNSKWPKNSVWQKFGKNNS